MSFFSLTFVVISAICTIFSVEATSFPSADTSQSGPGSSSKKIKDENTILPPTDVQLTGYQDTLILTTLNRQPLLANPSLRQQNINQFQDADQSLQRRMPESRRGTFRTFRESVARRARRYATITQQAWRSATKECKDNIKVAPSVGSRKSKASSSQNVRRVKGSPVQEEKFFTPEKWLTPEKGAQGTDLRPEDTALEKDEQNVGTSSEEVGGTSSEKDRLDVGPALEKDEQNVGTSSEKVEGSPPKKDGVIETNGQDTSTAPEGSEVSSQASLRSLAGSLLGRNGNGGDKASEGSEGILSRAGSIISRSGSYIGGYMYNPEEGEKIAQENGAFTARPFQQDGLFECLLDAIVSLKITGTVVSSIKSAVSQQVNPPWKNFIKSLAGEHYEPGDLVVEGPLTKQDIKSGQLLEDFIEKVKPCFQFFKRDTKGLLKFDYRYTKTSVEQLMRLNPSVAMTLEVSKAISDHVGVRKNTRGEDQFDINTPALARDLGMAVLRATPMGRAVCRANDARGTLTRIVDGLTKHGYL